MAYNKWHNVNNLDECVQNKSLNVGTGKLNVKNLLEKWVEDFCCCCCCCCFLLCFFYYYYYYYFVECLASGKKVFWRFLKLIADNWGPEKVFEKYLWGIHFWQGWRLPAGNFTSNWVDSWVDLKNYAWILRTFSRTAINGSLLLFFSFIKTHCKHYFEILFHVIFAFIIFCFSLGLRWQNFIFSFKNRKKNY